MEIKYLENGQKVSLIGKVDELYVVKAIYHDEYADEEFEMESTQTVHKIFNEPPVAVYSDKIAELNSQIKELEEKRREALNLFRDARKDVLEFEKSYANHPQFKRIKNLLSGNIKYIVDFTDFKIESVYHDRYYTIAYFKLDRVRGEAKWILKEENNSEVYPAESKEEAQQILKDYILGKFNSGKDYNSYWKAKLIKAAKKHGVDVPDSFVEAERSKQKREVQDSIKEMALKLESEKKKLEAMMKEDYQIQY